jgi:hypothetical protein
MVSASSVSLKERLPYRHSGAARVRLTRNNDVSSKWPRDTELCFCFCFALECCFFVLFFFGTFGSVSLSSLRLPISSHFRFYLFLSPCVSLRSLLFIDHRARMAAGLDCVLDKEDASMYVQAQRRKNRGKISFSSLSLLVRKQTSNGFLDVEEEESSVHFE